MLLRTPASRSVAWCRLLPGAVLVAATLLARPAAAQGTAPSCHFLCAPIITMMPGMVRTHLAGGPRVRAMSTGAVTQLPSASIAEVIIAAASRTSVPHLSLFGSVQWLPNAASTKNPFTLYTASELGTHIRANAPTVTAGASISLLAPPETKGWFDAAVNVGDLFSQAARPDDRSAYTHKLVLDLVAHAHAFAWAPEGSYLHRTSVYAILDYVATGLPRVGDEVPLGRTFVSDARPLALVVGLALPITPPAK